MYVNHQTQYLAHSSGQQGLVLLFLLCFGITESVILHPCLGLIKPLSRPSASQASFLRLSATPFDGSSRALTFLHF